MNLGPMSATGRRQMPSEEYLSDGRLRPISDEEYLASLLESPSNVPLSLLCSLGATLGQIIPNPGITDITQSLLPLTIGG